MSKFLADGGGLKMKILIWRFTEKSNFQGGLRETNRAWTVCRCKVGLTKEEGVVFLRGVDTPMHNMGWGVTLIDTLILEAQHEECLTSVN